MKTKIATALSLVGVLGAGSAAAMVNTQILDGGSGSADASGVLTETGTDTSTDDSSTDDSSTDDGSTTTDASTTTEPGSTVVITTPATTQPSGMLTTFNVGSSGTVTVDVQGGELVLVDAVPAAGWEVREAETDDDEVEVKFVDATMIVEFKVRLRDGELVPTVESKLRNAGGGGETTTTTPGGGVTSTTVDDDDDDHEDHDGDDDHGDDDGTDNTIDDDDHDDDETENTVDDDDDDEDDDHGGEDDDDEDDDHDDD